MCKTEKCKKKALYGYDYKFPIACGIHKLGDMEDVVHKRCEHIGCKTRPNYNHNGQKPSKFCKFHKLENMIDVNHPICEELECITRPSYSLTGKPPSRCSAHKLNGMVDVVSTRCQYCDTLAAFGYKDQRPVSCSIHRLDGMVNVISKSCFREKCEKQPIFALPGERPISCMDHVSEGMVDVVNPMCKFCNTRASFGYIYGKPISCITHKSEDMKNVVSRMCKYCDTRPTFGHTGNPPILCVLHKEILMVDVVNFKCKNCNLFQSTKINNYLCSYCNPDSTKKQKTKEDSVNKLLLKNNYTFVRDKQVGNNDCCFRYRPDFLFDCGTYFVVLECDEDAHNSYDKDCEIVRMNNITMSIGLPTKFIRYNPDLKGVHYLTKQKKLIETLNKWLNLELLMDPEPLYLFYTSL